MCPIGCADRTIDSPVVTESLMQLYYTNFYHFTTCKDFSAGRVSRADRGALLSLIDKCMVGKMKYSAWAVCMRDHFTLRQSRWLNSHAMGTENILSMATLGIRYVVQLASRTTPKLHNLLNRPWWTLPVFRNYIAKPLMHATVTGDEYTAIVTHPHLAIPSTIDSP